MNPSQPPPGFRNPAKAAAEAAVQQREYGQVPAEAVTPAPEPDMLPRGEVERLVAAEVAKATAQITEMLARAQAATAATGVVPEGLDTSNADFTRALAMAIAELSDQGTNRKRVAPEVLVGREQARERMLSLIVEARTLGETPVYTLRHKVYLDEVLVDPIWVDGSHVQRPTEIGWGGIPNNAMRPVNDIATRIYEAFCESIGSSVSEARQDGPMRVTAGGLTIMGRPQQQREAGHVGRGQSGGGLQIRGRSPVGAVKETRVLGTIAAPARKNW